MKTFPDKPAVTPMYSERSNVRKEVEEEDGQNMEIIAGWNQHKYKQKGGSYRNKYDVIKLKIYV